MALLCLRMLRIVSPLAQSSSPGHHMFAIRSEPFVLSIKHHHIYILIFYTWSTNERQHGTQKQKAIDRKMWHSRRDPSGNRQKRETSIQPENEEKRPRLFGCCCRWLFIPNNLCVWSPFRSVVALSSVWLWCQNKYFITCNRYIYIFVGYIFVLSYPFFDCMRKEIELSL